jgi:hypothetical protein
MTKFSVPRMSVNQCYSIHFLPTNKNYSIKLKLLTCLCFFISPPPAILSFTQARMKTDTHTHTRTHTCRGHWKYFFTFITLTVAPGSTIFLPKSASHTPQIKANGARKSSLISMYLLQHTELYLIPSSSNFSFH